MSNVAVQKTIKKVNIYDTINAIENATKTRKQLQIDYEEAIETKQNFETSILQVDKIIKELTNQLLEELK